jgi:hypothetical protein
MMTTRGPGRAPRTTVTGTSMVGPVRQDVDLQGEFASGAGPDVPSKRGIVTVLLPVGRSHVPRVERIAEGVTEQVQAQTVTAMARPGNTVTQGASRMKARPSLRMFPQLGVGGGVPAPMKLRPASARMA